MGKQKQNDQTRVRINQVARLIRTAGGSASLADMRAALGGGAPANEDDTIDLVHLTAWLAEQVD